MPCFHVFPRNDRVGVGVEGGDSTIEFPSLRLGDREEFRIGFDALPDLLD